MNPPALQRDNKTFAPVLDMAMELSNRTWKLLFGDGARRCRMARQGTVHHPQVKRFGSNLGPMIPQ